MKNTTELLIKIRETEERLFICLDQWNNEDYMSNLMLCDKIKLSNRIDSLNIEYSMFCAQKQ